MTALAYSGIIGMKANKAIVAYDIDNDGSYDLMLMPEDEDGNQTLELMENKRDTEFDITLEPDQTSLKFFEGARVNSYYESIRFKSESVAISDTEEIDTTPKTEEKKDIPFIDVRESDYYFDAVAWAFNNEPQVTTGVSETLFSPASSVTRGQAVTFLWRSMGCPEPEGDIESLPFVDLKSDYYKKAVVWAVEQGITKGTDSKHFSPDAPVTTAHMVTFLYRTLGIGNDGWYEEAAMWAEKKMLMGDTGLDISPSVYCPRG
jgi:hypothetical protein